MGLKTIPFMSLDLTPGHGNLLGESYWELISPWLGGSSMLNTGPAPLSEEDVYTLSQILEDSPHRRYYLSRIACLGILRRARERGKELPAQLKAALTAQAVCRNTEPNAFAADEVRALHNRVGILGAQPIKDSTQTQQSGSCGERSCSKMSELSHLCGSEGYEACSDEKRQTFIAGFSAGSGASAGSIGYSERISPTLKGSASGNCMPSVLCLNDQGGSIMDCAEDISGALRAQEHGHQPLVYENHGIDARYKGPLPVFPTITARSGTGGNNLPILEVPPCCCMTDSGNDRHAVFSRQRVDLFREDNAASTESARQYKDATDLICREAKPPLLVRRLTPLECERLQGFPDGWTALPGASDSARYKALGNSVAIPCVEYIMRGVVMAAGY